jgi:hypothetical protein
LRTTDWGETGVYSFADFGHVYFRPSTTRAPKGTFTFQLIGTYARPTDDGTFMDSPYVYHVSWATERTIPANLVRRVHDGQLATVRTDVAASAPDQLFDTTDGVRLHAPTTFTELYTPGITWDRRYLFGTTDGTIEQAPQRTFTLGPPVLEHWNRAVLAPGLPDPAQYGPVAARFGDELGFDLTLFSGQDHWGNKVFDPATLTLSTGGHVIGTADGTFGLFTVPAQPAHYTLSAATTHPGSTVSTTVNAAWSFDSGHAGDEGATIPFMAIRFAPDVDRVDSAPAGRPFTIPISVDKLAGPAYGDVRTVRVDVSYDDGKTWRPAPLTGTGWHRTATVNHPTGPGFVSLRANVEDTKGNTAEVTVIRAYALR